jgi:hypothetical protein
MKKIMVVIIILLFGGLVSASDEPNNISLSLKASSLEIAPEIFYHRYTEPDMKEDGVFYGININAYERKWVKKSHEGESKGIKWVFGGEFEFGYGLIDYNGELMDEYNTPYTVTNINDFLVDTRFLIGYDLPLENKLQTIYSGIGYRFLQDDSSFDPSGYLRRSNYIYLPIGLKMMGSNVDGWAIGGSLEFDALLYGEQYSDIYGYDIRNDQTTGFGIRAAIDLIKEGKKTDFKIQPFIRYWNIDKSDVREGFYEPKNKTIQAGMALVWSF